MPEVINLFKLLIGAMGIILVILLTLSLPGCRFACGANVEAKPVPPVVTVEEKVVAAPLPPPISYNPPPQLAK